MPTEIVPDAQNGDIPESIIAPQEPGSKYYDPIKKLYDICAALDARVTELEGEE